MKIATIRVRLLNCPYETSNAFFCTSFGIPFPSIAAFRFVGAAHSDSIGYIPVRLNVPPKRASWKQSWRYLLGEDAKRNLLDASNVEWHSVTSTQHELKNWSLDRNDSYVRVLASFLSFRDEKIHLPPVDSFRLGTAWRSTGLVEGTLVCLPGQVSVRFVEKKNGIQGSCNSSRCKSGLLVKLEPFCCTFHEKQPVYDSLYFNSSVLKIIRSTVESIRYRASHEVHRIIRGLVASECIASRGWSSADGRRA